MLKKYIYTCLLAALALFTVSCTKEDLGNYEYHDINEVNISPETNGTITAVVTKPLIIRPKVEFTQDAAITDPSRYSYEWRYALISANSVFITLATTKDLDVITKMAVGKYYLWYYVTDKVTGVVFNKRFDLEVRNEIGEGWYLMTEVNGKARLDMLALQGSNYLVDPYITIKDVLANTGSALVLKGKPKMIYCYYTGAPFGYGINLTYGVYLGTDQSTDRVDPTNFAWKPDYNVKKEFLSGDLPDNFSIAQIKRHSGGGNASVKSNAYMVSTVGDLYFNGPNATPASKLGSPLNFNATTKLPYQVAPFIGACENGNGTLTFTAIFYDSTNKRFMRHSVGTSAAASLATITEPNGTVAQPILFSYGNVGMDLIYMTGGMIKTATLPQVYAVFKDPATAKYWLFRFEQTGLFKQIGKTEIIAPDIDKAEHFEVSPLTGYLFYNVGSKLYLYDPFQATPLTTMVKDYGAEKISALKFEIYHNSITVYPNTEKDKLWVCYYDPAGTEGENGKMDKFSINLGGAGLAKEGNTFTGFGKVQSLHYREK